MNENSSLERLAPWWNGSLDQSSKKWENREAMFALFAAWYNFCRRHQTIKTTPAVAAGLADEPWSLERLLTESARVQQAA
jgi:hypothetical protein